MKQITLFLAIFLLTCQAQAQNTISFSGTIASISSSETGYQVISSAGNPKKFLAYNITFQNANSTLQLRCMGFEHRLGVSIREEADDIAFDENGSYTFTLTPCCIGHKSFYGEPNFYSVFAIPQSTNCSLVVLNPTLKTFTFDNLADRQPYVEYQGKLYRIDITESNVQSTQEMLHFGN